jgi:dihydrofolate synthase/folylpolyglutamate synthase
MTTAITTTALQIEPDPAARQAAVDWLLGRINYERTAEIPYNERQLKLDRMRQLLTRLGQPDAGMKIVHVAGTKGKGSTAALIAGVLTAAGFRTGVFTSPHLQRIEERFSVDGQACSAAELIALVDRVRPIVAAMDEEASAGEETLGPPTFFEIVTAIALLHFVERRVDAAVLEVGLGGRLDSTNVCLPAVSVITSISFDHTRQLGNTLAAIAAEKAGIIKPGVPVVCGVTQPEPQAVIADVAREHGCRLIQLGREFSFDYATATTCATGSASACGDERFVTRGLVTSRPVSTLAEPVAHGMIGFTSLIPGQEFELAAARLAMLGPHQAANAAVALAAILELRNQGWCLSTDAIRDGLRSTLLPGRTELIATPSRPTVVLDVAHNPASARALVETLAELPTPTRRTLILSISRDKDVRAIVAELAGHFDRVLVTQYQENPRATAAEELAAIVREAWRTTDENTPTAAALAPIVELHATPASAWSHACATALQGELVCISGSFFLAAEMGPIVRSAE